MKRGSFLTMTLMMSVALFAGVLVGSLVPPVSTASAQGLKLAPPAAPTASVVVPSFADLADRAIPSVVHINNRSVQEEVGTEDDPFDGIPGPFRRFFEQPQPEDRQGTRPRRLPREASGSGFFITTDGYILTNRHVVEGAEKLLVTTSEKTDIPAKLVGTDPHMDLAVIKIDVDHAAPALPLGDSDALRVGEWVMAIGNPLILDNSVTVGVVSGKERSLGAGDLSVGDYIQTDAAINFGNSGGPLLNARGEVVGINTAIVRGGADGRIEGIGFALPISLVKRVITQLVETGTVKRGYMGVTVRPIDSTMVEFYKLKNRNGALVARVNKGMPADKAGLRAEDIILSVEGRSIRNSNDLVNVVSAYSPGDKIKLQVLRDGKEMSIPVVLVARGSEDDAAAPAPSRTEPNERENGEVEGLGITVAPLPPELRERLAEKEIKGGVVVREVDGTSDAARQGLAPRMVILDVNRTPIRTLADYRSATASIAAGSVVRLRVLTAEGDEQLYFFRVEKK